MTFIECFTRAFEKNINIYCIDEDSLLTMGI